MANDPLAALPRDDLCRRCREETEHYRRARPVDGRFCLEIFRRAIVEHDQACWSELYDIYHDQALMWCRRAGAGQHADHEEIITEAWTRFWRYFTTTKLEEATGIAGVLTYLRSCIFTVVIDQRRRQVETTPLDPTLMPPDTVPGPDEALAAAAAVSEFWRTVHQHLHDERERVLMHMKYILLLRSAEIQHRYPALFPTVDDVYRITRNVLDRLRRSPAIRRFVEEGIE
jgi:DNA-directed RNA polymerase specialized sigma24 family protein